MRVLIIAISTLAVFICQEFNNLAQAAPSPTAPVKNSEINSAHHPDLRKIEAILPRGWVIRLPFKILANKNEYGLSNQNRVPSNPNSQSGLKANIFNCEQQLATCLVGSISINTKSSIEAQKEFKKSQNIGTPITLANNLQGYLLNGKNQKPSQLMWQQDSQFYTISLKNSSRENWVSIVNSIIEGRPIQTTVASGEVTQVEGTIQTTATTEVTQVAETAEEKTQDLSNNNLVIPSRSPVLTTAEQLRRGEILTTFRHRHFFTPGTAASEGLTDQPTIGISWGVTDNLELTVDAQTVDNAGPVRQGRFSAQRINNQGKTNFFQEFTFQAKQRLWQNESSTQALSGVVAASVGNGGRPYRFFDNTGTVATGQNKGTVFSLEFPYTNTPNDRLQFTVSPKVAFLSEDNALYLTKLPTANSGSFGTTFGLASGISYKLNPRLILWGDAFVPFTGNNTINRDTGLPSKTVAYNAGLRYLVNPRLATDLFVSNTLGNTGALSVVADKEYTALGFGVTYLPGITSANRQYADNFRSIQPPPSTYAGFSSLDGGTIPKNQLLLTLQAGGQGFLPGIRFGLLDDFEIGAFLDNIPGTVDESQFGFSGKVRLLHQADGDPFTLSVAGTIARSNNVLVNLINNNRNRFKELGLEKGGFAFSNEKEGELFILTLSTPIHYQFSGGSAAWVTPTLGFVQRQGLEIAGFNFGGSVPLSRELDAIAEIGVDVTGKGNAFIGNDRESVIPWTIGLRWQPSNLFGAKFSEVQLEAYFTNRLGSSPFDSLRVRADNETAVGVGVILPIQF
jgi:hypothetical protein